MQAEFSLFSSQLNEQNLADLQVKKLSSFPSFSCFPSFLTFSRISSFSSFPSFSSVPSFSSFPSFSCFSSFFSFSSFSSSSNCSSYSSFWTFFTSKIDRFSTLKRLLLLIVWNVFLKNYFFPEIFLAALLLQTIFFRNCKNNFRVYKMITLV